MQCSPPKTTSLACNAEQLHDLATTEQEITESIEGVQEVTTKRASAIPRLSGFRSLKFDKSQDMSIPPSVSIDAEDKAAVAVQTVGSLRPLSRIPILASRSTSIDRTCPSEDPALLYERSRLGLKSVKLSQLASLSIESAELPFNAGNLKRTNSPFLKSASEEATRISDPHWTQVEFDVPSLPVTPRIAMTGNNDNIDVPRYYSLTQLITSPYPRGVAASSREYYLNDADFEVVMGMSKENWTKIPTWRKVVIKKRVGLF